MRMGGGNSGRIATAAVLAVLLWLGSVGSAGAMEPRAVSPGQLGGHTLSAVVFVPRPPGQGGGTLQRLVLQAYLAADGSAVVRQWLGARNRYSTPAPTRWSLADNTLCVDLPTGPLCARVHLWGPRIAGIGIRPYVMLDGDLQPGNAIGPPR
jgi:hypothetical protein